jgi:hypothetical protein
MLAYIHKQALDNQRLPYACLLSTKGAYYVVNKQAQIKRQLRSYLLLMPSYLCLLI